MLLLASSFLPLDEHFAFSSTLEGLFSSNKNWMLMYNDYINKARFETYAIAYNALHCQCKLECGFFMKFNVKLERCSRKYLWENTLPIWDRGFHQSSHDYCEQQNMESIFRIAFQCDQQRICIRKIKHCKQKLTSKRNKKC